MGLTLHYRLTAPDGLTARQAAALVRRLHRAAQDLKRSRRIEKVLSISSASSELKRWACAYRTLPHPTEPDTSIGVSIAPDAGWIFPVELGADSELLWLGLCRYPRTVVVEGRSRATRLGARWQFAASCKTHYASLHGWEHFARCHVAAVDLLGAGRAAGLQVKISDEGGYWPGRSRATLQQRIDQMNGVVAALAGALKDSSDETGRGASVTSPIFRHPHFERIEAEGAEKNSASLAETVRVISKLSEERDGPA
jgi:hypothetical protein